MSREHFKRLAEQLGLRRDFPPEVEAEVQAYLAAPGIDDPALIDRTAMPFVTIDGPGTRDLDQAMHVEELKGGWRLRYAIADAAYYVRPGTALFAEALLRGASYYLPGFSVPMLPRPLSEHLISLGPDVDRRALVFDVDFDATGTVTSFTLERARIRSVARLSFEQAQQFVEVKHRGPPGPRAIGPVLRAAHALGLLRERHADRASMVRYRRVETSLRLAPDGSLVVSSSPRTEMERANEQLSILCNALGARFLAAGPPALVQPIYRVHEPPDPERVDAFERMVAAIAHERDLPDDPWLYRQAADLGLAGYLEALPTAGLPGRLARALHRQAMLLNGRSRFEAEPRGHFGVGEQVYSRFTAPMRELVGVQCHAQAIERLQGRSERSRDEDEAIRAAVIDAGNRAKDVQRQIDREVDAQIVAAVLGPDLERPEHERPRRAGTVVGFQPGKIHLLLDDPPIDVRAPMRAVGERFGGAWLTIVDDDTRLVRDKAGTTVCRLGDLVHVVAIARDAVVLVDATDADVAPPPPAADPLTEVSGDPAE